MPMFALFPGVLIAVGAGLPLAAAVRPRSYSSEIPNPLDLFPCKGTPDPEQQLSGKVLKAICTKIQKSGAKFLVFGLGRDSEFWYNNTDQQNVVFLENHPEWLRFQSPGVQAATWAVQYTTDMRDYKNVLQDGAKLAEFFDSLPSEVRNTQWDVILVDSPMGMVDGAGQPQPGTPGRMQSMFAALRLARDDSVIFVDDYQRTVEKDSAEVLLAPHALDRAVFDNGHHGKTAMFVMNPRRHAIARTSVLETDLSPCKGTPDPEQQLSGKVLKAICKKIQKSGAKFLVFGLGRDSEFWYNNTDQQNVVFLENHPEWLRFQSPGVQAATRAVQYTTDMRDYKNVLQDEAKLAEFFDSLPSEVRSTQWDVILVDSPMGMVDGAGRPQPGTPGRMQSMFAALRLAREDTVVFVDDFQRTVEKESAEVLLAPHAWDHIVFDNGHQGKTAMFMMHPEH